MTLYLQSYDFAGICINDFYRSTPSFTFLFECQIAPSDLKHFVTAEAMSIRRGTWHQSAAVLELQPVELQHLQCLREGTTGTLNTCLGSKCNSGAQMNVWIFCWGVSEGQWLLFVKATVESECIKSAFFLLCQANALDSLNGQRRIL